MNNDKISSMNIFGFGAVSTNPKGHGHSFIGQGNVVVLPIIADGGVKGVTIVRVGLFKEFSKLFKVRVLPKDDSDMRITEGKENHLWTFVFFVKVEVIDENGVVFCISMITNNL